MKKIDRTEKKEGEMHTWKKRVGFTILAVCFCAAVTQAVIVVPGADGSDGALVVTNSITIDLGLAITGVWDDDNSANAGNGIYDSNQWAVVFKYSNVIISSNCTVTFQNHPSRATVVWLVSGNVTIDGTLNLDGQSYQSAPNLAEPGPGGFRGGMARYTGSVDPSSGFGPGGGTYSQHGYGASHATAVTSSPEPYGNASLIPLIGGSGGGGCISDSGGGGGGGAMLVACSGAIHVAGLIQADGGPGGHPYYQSGGGSGGAIRLVSDSFGGSGNIYARGGAGTGIPGGNGRIRIERVTNSGTVSVVPDPSILGLETNAAALIWPPTNAPQVRIVSVGGVDVPGDPRAEFGTTTGDIALPQTNSAAIVIETVNVEPASEVEIRLTPRHSANYWVTNATVSATNNLDPLTLLWVATPPIETGYSAVQVRVIRP